LTRGFVAQKQYRITKKAINQEKIQKKTLEKIQKIHYKNLIQYTIQKQKIHKHKHTIKRKKTIKKQVIK